MYLKFLSVIALGIFLTCATSSLRAEEVVIELTVNECSVSLSMPNGNSCDQNQCGADNTCICAGKGDHIKWKINNDDKFKLKFLSDSPLKDNCGKNYKADKHKCVVKDSTTRGESFTYDIKLERCSDGTDPKIVIK